MNIVYKITNTINDKVYIGITDNLERRWHEHKKEAKSKLNRPLYHAMNKYGIDQFTITPICSTLTREDLGTLEQRLIKEHNTMTPNGYNLTSGGERAWAFSEETKQKISDTKKGMIGTFTGQTHTEETRQKISNTMKTRVPWNKGKKGLQTHNKETRQKISDARKGNTPVNKGKYLPDNQVTKQALSNRKRRERQYQSNISS